MSPKPRRSYSSAGRSDEVATTEGITFDLDGVTFTCHGHLSAFDLAEFAGPVADAPDPENVSDPGVLRILSDFLRALMGQQTYIAFTAHRRKHRTPDEVVQQILFDLVEDVTSRPFPKPSPLRPGLPAPRRLRTPRPRRLARRRRTRRWRRWAGTMRPTRRRGCRTS